MLISQLYLLRRVFINKHITYIASIYMHIHICVYVLVLQIVATFRNELKTRTTTHTDAAWTPSNSFSTKLVDLSGENYNTCLQKVYIHFYIKVPQSYWTHCALICNELSVEIFIQFILKWRQVYKIYLHAYKPLWKYMHICMCVCVCLLPKRWWTTLEAS